MQDNKTPEQTADALADLGAFDAAAHEYGRALSKAPDEETLRRLLTKQNIAAHEHYLNAGPK